MTDTTTSNAKDQALLEAEVGTVISDASSDSDRASDYNELISEQVMKKVENGWKIHATEQNRLFGLALIVVCGIAALIGVASHNHYKETHPDLFGGYIVTDSSEYQKNQYIDNEQYYPNPCGDTTCRFSRDILVDISKGWNNGCQSVFCNEKKYNYGDYEGGDSPTYQALSYTTGDCTGCHFNGRFYAIGDKVDFEPDGCGNTCYCRPHEDNTKAYLPDSKAAVYCSAKPCDQCKFGDRMMQGGESIMVDECTKCTCPSGGGHVKCAKLCYNEEATQACLFEGEWYEINTCFSHPYNNNHVCGCYGDGTVACTADSRGKPIKTKH